MKRVRPFIALALSAGMALSASPAAAQAANATDAAALLQEAEDLRLGRGVPMDLEAALQLHRKLAETGRGDSYVRMADILVALGRIPEAVVALETGRDIGSDFARRRLAIGNVRGAFGELSDPVAGVAELREIVQHSEDQLAKYTLARAMEDGTGAEPDIAAAFEIYEAMADQGHGPALQRLGDFERNGTFGVTDLTAATGFYRASAEAGVSFSWVLLARAHMADGNQIGALEALNDGAAAGSPQAAVERATMHFLQEFGVLSDKAFGQSELKRLAEGGNVAAAARVLVLYERRSRRIMSLDLDGVLAMLTTQMQAGDETATAALARAYRVLRWRIPSARKLHAALVRDHGDQLGERNLVREALFDLYDPNDHPNSRVAAVEFVQQTEGEFYYNGVMGLRATEITAFVLLLQSELKALGHYTGPLSGLMTRSTVQATLQFCRDQGIYDTCIHGPLTYPAAVLLARALTDARRR